LTPIALINVYLQPQLISFRSWLFIFPIIENIDVLTILIIAFLYFKSPPTEARKYLIFVFLVWIIGGAIIGLTVPIQGAIARYKSVLMPFLLMSIISLIDWERLKSKYLTTG